MNPKEERLHLGAGLRSPGGKGELTERPGGRDRAEGVGSGGGEKTGIKNK